MTKRTLVLDTNAFDVRGSVYWLNSYPGRKVLPLVAYVELGVLYNNTRGRLGYLRATLDRAGVEIEWMRTAEGERAIASDAQVGDFAENARDHLVAAHAAHGSRVLVTSNARDFSFVREVKTPEQVMRGRD